ncbi:MAG TPA: high-potential iron-sulfur protein [Steroidobacteraceae bacterium]|nr:high-potential iron-sulfur protein [Steroidobacteraceae bacterium]
MSDPLSRRAALKQLALLLGAAGVADACGPAHAAELPHLDPSDPNAVALAYHRDASTVDVKQFPTYRSGQRCDTCLQLQGKPGDPWRPCNLFPGELVSAGGWCRVWVPKN